MPRLIAEVCWSSPLASSEADARPGQRKPVSFRHGACHQFRGALHKPADTKKAARFRCRLICVAWGGRWGSNPRPLESQSRALPTELRPPWKPVNSFTRAATGPAHLLCDSRPVANLAPRGGFEPPTNSLEGYCSIRLSYRGRTLAFYPKSGRGREIRTPDILLPKQARYQTALYPEWFFANLRRRQMIRASSHSSQ